MIKLFRSTTTGAPVLSNTAGSYIQLLDAVLINGYNLITLDSLTVVGNVATGVFSSGHGWLEHEVILIAGSNIPALSGEFKIKTVTASDFTFDVVTPDIVSGGTVTAKTAPVGGWVKLFSGTNKAIYQNQTPSTSNNIMRVDHTGTTFANVSGAISATDVDTLINEFMVGGKVGNFTAATEWTFIADEKTCWVGGSFGMFTFGEVTPLNPSDDGIFSVSGTVSTGLQVNIINVSKKFDNTAQDTELRVSPLPVTSNKPLNDQHAGYFFQKFVYTENTNDKTPRCLDRGLFLPIFYDSSVHKLVVLIDSEYFICINYNSKTYIIQITGDWDV